MPFVLKNATHTEDGGRPCYDVVSTAAEIHRAYKQGFLQIDDDRQRGKNTVTGRRIVDQKKIDRWAEKLVEGNGYLGQLTWNIRKEGNDAEPELEYDEGTRMLTINALSAYLPDSFHRTSAVVKAVDSIAKGSTFEKNRKISIRIYNAPADEENAIFYAYNQEGKPADQARSKWLRPHSFDKIAREFVARSPHLGDANVDTFQDRLSKKSYRLASFGTVAKAIESAWSSESVDDAEKLEAAVGYLIAFWDKLVSVRPELGKLPLSERQKVRETTLVDGALSLAALIKLAHRMYREQIPLDVLEKLGEKVGEHDFFSRENPRWRELSVLVPEQGKKGVVYNVRNIRQTRESVYDEICNHLGLAATNAGKGASA